MGFLTGYQRNKRRASLVRLSAVHAAGAIPASVNLRPHAPAIFDQGQTSSCVGHARARGLNTSAAAAGAPLPFILSPKMLYTLARCAERFFWDIPLTDTGSDPNDTIIAAQKYGVSALVSLADRYSDCAPDTVNDEPDLLSLETGIKFADDYQVPELGGARRALVTSALASGHAVCFDVAGGSEEWQNYSSGIIGGPAGPLDHYVCAVGYTIDNMGALTLLVDNSWGTSWGQGGTCLVNEVCLQGASDVIVNAGVRA